MEKFISCRLLHCLILKMLPSCFHEFPKSSCLGIRFHSECIPLIKNQFLKKLKKKSEPCSWLIMRYGSVQFSRSVMSDYFWPHESQDTRPLHPSAIPGVHPNPCPSSRWCHPAISSSVLRFSSCPQSLPTSEFFRMSQLFAWGSTVRVTQKGSQRYMEKRRGRRELEVTQMRSGGINSGESDFIIFTSSDISFLFLTRSLSSPPA